MLRVSLSLSLSKVFGRFWFKKAKVLKCCGEALASKRFVFIMCWEAVASTNIGVVMCYEGFGFKKLRCSNVSGRHWLQQAKLL